MNRFVTFCATALVIAAGTARGQDSNPQSVMSVPEFRQVLVDLGTYLDAHKNTNLRQRFEATPDDTLNAILPAVANPRALQRAVAGLKQDDAGRALESRPKDPARLPFKPLAVFPGCPTDTIIDTSSSALCTPSYPDPTNTAWQSLVNPLIPINAFSPTDFTSVSSQSCGLTVESNLSIASSVLTGTVLAASAVCSALPPVASQACWIANAAFSIGAATSVGLFADCSEQDGNVNAAEIDAAFHNTVTIYDKLGAVDTDVDTNISNLNTHLTSVDTDIDGNITNLNTHLSSVDTDIDGNITNLNTHVTNVNTDIDTKIASLDTHIQNEFAALSTTVTTVVGNLSSQLAAAESKLDADEKQIMKLHLELQGLQQIYPSILTCDGSAANPCPNVLNACPLGKCVWNGVGPIP